MCDPIEADWPTDPSSYELIGKIGQGAFATVWRASTGEKDHVALKILNLDNVDTNLAEIRLEVQSMRLSSHNNVLQCYTAFVHDTSLWLVTQLMRKGSALHCLSNARKALQQNNKASNTNTTTNTNMQEYIFYILHETLLGLNYIHTNGQIHRDIKAGNILLDASGHVRIADFGVSGWLVHGGSQLEKAKTFIGTPCWMAPEVMVRITRLYSVLQFNSTLLLTVCVHACMHV
jgi:serine/threonine-protein kinase OSR1/STK39